MPSSFRFPLSYVRWVLMVLVAAVGMASTMQAQVVVAPPPTVGSANPVSAEPLVTRPSTTPCVVPLFNNLAFDGSDTPPFTYTPPANCPGPWAKVVFTADFTVSAGIQFDRSPEFFLGNATLYRGTTSEPSPNQSPSWHIEGDVTDLSALFNAPQTGIAACGNVVDSTYTGIIYANAALEFYPVSATAPAAVVPDAVIPIVVDPTSPVQAFSTTSPLTLSVTLPKNTMQVYLDVISQVDEFWWLSTPNAQVAPLIQNVDTTALREMDVSIDGTPAGIAPNHPYIFTGGIDPFLWFPITGAQTLHLQPYRINLTPFAGVLADGNPHTLVINDINTIGDAYLNADMFVYEDHGSTAVTGGIISNTLTATPATTVTSNVNLDSSNNGEAQVMETLNRTFAISGYVNTSQGKITTTVNETVDFSSTQNVTSSNSDNVLTDVLASTVDAFVTTATPAGTTTVEKYTSNPLQAFIAFNVNDDGSYAQTTTAELKDEYKTLGPGSYTSDAREDVQSTDTLGFDENFNLTSQSGQNSMATYVSTDSLGNNYSSTLTAANNVLTGVTTGSSSAAVTVFLSASATTATQGAPVTLNATVTPANSTLAPTGYVTFYLAGAAAPTVLGTVPVTGGAASLTLSTLSAGADVVTAAYSGDTNFTATPGLNAVTVTVTALPAAITLGALSPASMTLTAGQTGVISLPVTANATFSGAVAFTCTGAPAETACVVNPVSVTLTAGETANVSVVVSTTAPNNKAMATNRLPGLTAFGGVSVAGLLLMLIPARRSRRLKMLMLAVVAVLGLGATAAMSGCSSGNGGYKFSGTPAGTSTITVTAQTTAGTQTATFTLTVQ